MIRRYILLLLVLVISGHLNAQYVDRGQDPAGIKWKQINNDDFQLIYPDNCEEVAQYYANILHFLYNKDYSSLGHKPKKVSVIMHTNGGLSNGTVYWAPGSLELYTTPSQNGDYQLWPDHLTCHEFRHVVQIDKLNHGFTGFLTYLFGEQATAVVLGAYVPMWFLEGDAVSFETAMTKAGRGRLPEFTQIMKAQLVEKGRYSYDKAVLGSYKDYVPDRYKLGYYMVANARKHYGTAIWESALRNVGDNPLGITSFARGIRDVTAVKRDSLWDSFEEEWRLFPSDTVDIERLKNDNYARDAKVCLYNDNMTELAMRWRYEDSKNEYDSYEEQSILPKVYTSYVSPRFDDEGNVIALKSGMADIETFVKILPDKTEKKIYAPGYNVEQFDYRNGKLVWSEYDWDARWSHGGRHIIVKYDIAKAKRKVYRYKYNMFAPSVSEDGTIVVTGNKTDESVFIALIDDEGVRELCVSDHNEQFQSPCWCGDDVVFVTLDHKGKRLEKVNIHTGVREVLSDYYLAEITDLRYKEGKLLLSASFSGKNEIYAYDTDRRELVQLTHSRFGAKYPDMQKGKLLFSDYSVMGYKAATADYSESKPSEPYRYELAETLKEQERSKKSYEIEKDSIFESKRYSKATHLFNVHSWAPVFIDGIEREYDVGVSFASQNMLSTLLMTGGYRNDNNYDSGVGYLNFSYRGWWPIFNVTAKYGKVNSTYMDNNGATGKVGEKMYYYGGIRKRFDLECEVQLPIDLSSGRYSRKIVPSAEYALVRFDKIDIDWFMLLTKMDNENMYDMDPVSDYSIYDFNNDPVTANLMTYSLFAYNLEKKAMRDINSRFGQVLDAGYRNTIAGDIADSYTYYASGRLYLPGVAKHHSIDLYGGYQYYGGDAYAATAPFSLSINSPRGVKLSGFDEVAVFRGTYSMPLWYPDFNIGALAYIKRFTLGAFFDYGDYSLTYMDTNRQERYHNGNMHSYGLELRSDMHFLRLSAPVNMGVRCGYESGNGKFFTDFLMSFTFDF